MHGDQVVELSVQLEVQEREEEKEDGEGQVEVEREEGELKEKRSCTWMTNDTHEHLSQEVHVTQHQSVTKTTSSQCMLRCCASCASVFVSLYLVVDVVCLMLVLSAHVVLLAVCIQFS